MVDVVWSLLCIVQTVSEDKMGPLRNCLYKGGKKGSCGSIVVSASGLLRTLQEGEDEMEVLACCLILGGQKEKRGQDRSVLRSPSWCKNSEPMGE